LRWPMTSSAAGGSIRQSTKRSPFDIRVVADLVCGDAADARDGSADCAGSTAQLSAVAGDATGRGLAPYGPGCGHRFGAGCRATRAGIPLRCKRSRWLDAGCGSGIPVRQRDGSGVSAGASGRTRKSDGSPSSRILILTSLASEPKHGYALLKDVEQISGSRVQLSTGTLYGAIRRLLEDGRIERYEQEDKSRCRELLSPMLLAAITGKTEEKDKAKAFHDIRRQG
jgi:hypothetical protein